MVIAFPVAKGRATCFIAYSSSARRRCAARSVVLCYAAASADAGVGVGVGGVATVRATLNHAAYSAGTKKIVSAVAMVRPPMMAMAIGPQNTLRDSGIIASTVAAAVSNTGRVRQPSAGRLGGALRHA